jgi:hypothetical protein
MRKQSKYNDASSTVKQKKQTNSDTKNDSANTTRNEQRQK